MDRDDRLARYQPRALLEGQTPQALELAELARRSRLVVYAGAGLSVADPTCLPAGGEIASSVHADLQSLLGSLPPCDQADLTSVADAVSSIEGGLGLLKQRTVRAADFTTAEPSYGHVALGLLLLEGVLSVLTTNWDDCIERLTSRERVVATITEDERHDITAPALLKLHGCATRPATLLTTTAELSNPPPWVVSEAQSRLTDSVVAFVGIGDVAGYVVSRLQMAVDAVGDVKNIRVVGPSIQSDWGDTQWAQLLPKLDASRRLEATADRFLDDLAGAYLRLCFSDVRAIVSGDSNSDAVQKILGAIEHISAVEAILWFRSTLVTPEAGVSALQAGTTVRGLVALGIVCNSPLTISPHGVVHDGVAAYELLVGAKMESSARLRREANSRQERFLSRGGRAEDAPRFVVSGELPLPDLGAMPQDVVSSSGPTDLVSGPMNTPPILIDAMGVLGYG